jgi:hypothetical protein
MVRGKALEQAAEYVRAAERRGLVAGLLIGFAIGAGLVLGASAALGGFQQ